MYVEQKNSFEILLANVLSLESRTSLASSDSYYIVYLCLKGGSLHASLLHDGVKSLYTPNISISISFAFFVSFATLSESPDIW